MSARKQSKAVIVAVKHADRRDGRSVTYQRELVLCGKPGCSKRHGPYWYAYWKSPRDLFSKRGRLCKRYIGREWRPLTTAQAIKAEKPKKKPALGNRTPATGRRLPKVGSKQRR